MRRHKPTALLRLQSNVETKKLIQRYAWKILLNSSKTEIRQYLLAHFSPCLYIWIKQAVLKKSIRCK